METLIIKNNKDLKAYRDSNKISNLDLRSWEDEASIYMEALTVNECYMQDTVFNCFINQSYSTFLGDVFQSNTVFKRGVSQSKTEFQKSLLQSSSIFEMSLSQQRAIFKENLDQSNSVFGNLLQSGSKFKGNVDQSNSVFNTVVHQDKCVFHGEIKRNKISKKEIELLKRINIKELYMDNWQTNVNWKSCIKIEELHTCGTQYCIRGYAEAEYYIENGREIENTDLLLPNLKYLFYVSNSEAQKEIKRILNP